MSHLIAAFREIAEKRPTHLALVGVDEQYTYSGALARIDELSRHLVGGNHSAVLIVGPKQCDTVLWQLACNQAGKVFIPCDGATPTARLCTIVNRTQPRWIVGDSRHDFRSAGFEVLAEEPRQRVWVRAEFSDCTDYAAQVSHVIFTSGSTGQPKAILLPDTPVLDVVRAQAAVLEMGPESRFAWLLSPAFDASLSDIYSTLLSGGTLHVCDFGPSRVKLLKSYFTRHGITHTDVPPSVLHLLNPLDFPHVRAIVFGGELASEEAVRTWTANGKKLFNAYGPTETTICSSMRYADASWSATNVGKPLPGVEYFLMTQQGLRVDAAGERGELYVAGTHLALGYDSTEMTDLRFVQVGARRCYRTGDLVEIDSQGDYHFKGRVDRQMKIHGVLLCPEEVEMFALRAGCAEARLKLEDKHLVLHYSGPVEKAALKAALALVLHPVAVPHRYCKQNSLPKSLTGKIQA